MKKFLLLAMAYLVAQTMYAQQKQGSITNVRKLTSGSEQYEAPRWSPDGSMISFTNRGFDNLYVMNADGSARARLAEGSGIGYLHRWSADNNEILVRDTRWTGGETGVGSHLHAILAVDLNGEVVKMTEDAEYLQPSSWRYTPSGLKKVTAPADIQIAASTKKLKSLPAKRVKSITADPASQISFECDGESLWAIDASGARKSIFTGMAACPALSPDGKRVAFCDVDDVVVMNIDGTSKKVIGRGFNPAWVNGSQIVFERTEDDGHTYLSGELFLADVAAGSVKQITNTPGMIEMYPTVSPDGNTLLFSSFVDGQIYVADFK